MRITYQQTAEDRSQAQSADLHQKFGGGSRFKTWLVLSAIAAIEVYRFKAEVREDAPLWIGVFIIVWVIVYISLKRRNKRKPNEALIIIDFDDAAVRVSCDRSESMTPWTAFDKFVETSESFLLYFRGNTIFFYIPKRAISGGPMAEQQLRQMLCAKTELSESGITGSPQSSVSIQPAAPALVAEFRYGFRDYIDVVLASWFTRGIMLMPIVMGFFVLYKIIHDPSHPPVDPTGLMLMWVPVVILLIGMPLVFAARLWFRDSSRHDLNQILIREDGITTRNSIGTSSVQWSHFAKFKETQFSFLIFGGGASQYFLFPKRAFVSLGDLEVFRSLLAHHLLRSRWFFR